MQFPKSALFQADLDFNTHFEPIISVNKKPSRVVPLLSMIASCVSVFGFFTNVVLRKIGGRKKANKKKKVKR